MYLDFLNKDINIKIIYTRRNGYSVKIIDDDNLELRIGMTISEEELYQMLYKHRRFLITHLDGTHTKSKNVIHLLGKEYKLEIINESFNNVLIDDSNMIFKVYTKKDNDRYIKYIIDEYYKVVLKDILNRYNERIRNDLKIDFNVDFDFKNVKSYYGECMKKQRLIILSTNLAKYELNYILSVIYHEYAHFYVSGHGDKFYNILEKVFPNYKKTQSNLRKTKYSDLY